MSNLLRVNWILASLAGLLLLASLLWLIWPASRGPLPPTPGKPIGTPVRPFTQPEEAYNNLADTVFALELSAPTLQLPDLTKHLTYYGRNKRPDTVGTDQRTVNISLRGSGGTIDVKSIEVGQPIYLAYQKNGRRGNYELSADNAPTGLWFEARPKEKGDELKVTVSMLDQNGELVTRPPELREISLPERPLPRYGTGRWDLDGEKVDANLLSRQKARWEGQDMFLTDHGGKALAADALRERISFEKENEHYAIRLAEGEYAVWREGRWRNLESSTEATAGLPLLLLKQLEERTLTFEIWDPDGKSVVSARIGRSTPQWRLSFIQKEVRFAGARTRSSLNLDVGTERLVVQPDDWFILIDNEHFKKIDTVDMLDSYVHDTLWGMLFVIEGVDKEDGQQVLRAHIYNEGRSQKKAVVLRAQEPFVTIAGVTLPTPVPPKTGQKNGSNSNAPAEEAAPAGDENIEPVTPFELPADVNPEEIRKRWEQFRKENPPPPAPPPSPTPKGSKPEGRDNSRKREPTVEVVEESNSNTFQLRKGRLVPNQ